MTYNVFGGALNLNQSIDQPETNVKYPQIEGSILLLMVSCQM